MDKLESSLNRLDLSWEALEKATVAFEKASEGVPDLLQGLERRVEEMKAAASRLDQINPKRPSIWIEILMLVVGGVLGGLIAGVSIGVFDRLMPPSEIQHKSKILFQMPANATPEKLELFRLTEPVK